MLTRFLVIRVGYKSAGFIFIFGLVPTRAVGGLLLCPGRQSKQSALLCLRAESTHNHRQGLHKLIFILLFLLTFSAIFGRCLSVIMRFLPSASWVLFSAHLCLKLLSSIVNATFCYCHALYISHCFPLPFTLYSLP